MSFQNINISFYYMSIKGIYNNIGNIELSSITNSGYEEGREYDYHNLINKINYITKFQSVDELMYHFIKEPLLSNFTIELALEVTSDKYSLVIDIFSNILYEDISLIYSIDWSLSSDDIEVDKYIQLRCKELKRMSIIDNLLNIDE